MGGDDSLELRPDGVSSNDVNGVADTVSEANAGMRLIYNTGFLTLQIGGLLPHSVP